MRSIINGAVRMLRAGQRAYTRKWSFLALFLLIFFGSVSILAAYDLLPERASRAPVQSVPLVQAPIMAITTPELPVRIVVSSIGLDATIANPATTSISALDEALFSGAVRYPTSARLGEDGNVLLFGHSSYLPVVRNPAYKTFNNIQKMQAGDTIDVYSGTMRYTYAVRTVRMENTSTAVVPLRVEGRVLTLSTCDSFGAKSDRFVVTAGFVGSQPNVK